MIHLLATFAAMTAIAQPPASPLDAATASRADSPIAADTKPVISDPEIEKLTAALVGSFAAPAAGDTPALRFNSTAINVDGLDNAVYFELTRDDAPASPFRQGVFHAYRKQSELRLRVFDIAGAPGLKDVLTGLWAAPDVFPALTTASLDPNLDLVLAAAGSGWTGATPHPYPTARDGAIEMTASITIGDGEVRLTDTGLAADGSKVWGQAAGSSGPVFKRTAAQTARVQRVDGGLTVITLLSPDADQPKLVENGEVVVQYSGWLTDGSPFDSSRRPGREPFKLRVPGPVIKGWNEGLKEMAKGERRRLIIPPTMAYGERGTRDGRIPPNSTLVFDVECVYLDNTQPAAPAGGMVNPHGGNPSAVPGGAQTPPPQPPPQPGATTPPPAGEKKPG